MAALEGESHKKTTGESMGKHTTERTTWKEEAISAPIRTIGDNIRQHGKESLSEEEREAFATIDEAAYLVSSMAGRPIAPRYIRSLRTTGRLKKSDTKPAGNTFLYKIGALVDLRFYQRDEGEETATGGCAGRGS